MLLLDGGDLAGSCFQRTVVLVCQHTPEGAFGLVLNQPGVLKVGDVLEADLPDAVKADPLFQGGPVEPSTVTFLHSNPLLLEGSVLPQLSAGHALEELQDIAGGYAPNQKLRIFAGYAGWSPGQLDAELKRGSWLIHPASIELVLDHDPATLWRQIVRTKGPKYRLLADSPDDLSWN
jgi:putative transcriptional regulator